MAAVTENDLKRLEDLIIALRDENRTGIAALQKDTTEIKESLKGLDKRLSLVETSIQKIPDLAEKVGELKNWRQIVVIAVTALISGAVTWVIRGGSFKP